MTTFTELSTRILKHLHDFDPANARTFVGLHTQYDSVMPDYSRAGIEAFIQICRQDLAHIQALTQAATDTTTPTTPTTPTSLTQQENFELELLRFKLESAVFNLDEKRDWEKSPLFYLDAVDLLAYTTRDYAPLPERVTALTRHQLQIPALVEAMRANLKPPFARPVMEMGLMLWGGAVQYRQHDIIELLKSQELSTQQRTEGEKANQEALTVIQSLLEWLKGQADQYDDNFAIGSEMYQKLLRYDELLEMPLADVLATGEHDLESNYQEMVATAKLIDPQATVKEVLESLQAQHPTAAELMAFTQNRLENIRQFLVDHDLISLPNEVRPIVAPTPPPLRFGFAMMFPAGAYDKSPESYYYITLPEQDWDAARQEGWMRMFYNVQMENISVHEVYPGHFVHFMHVRESDREVSKQLFGSMAHVEGWAHYTEQMMLEEGFGKGDPAFKMAQLYAAIWRDCRYVASIKMHTQSMTVEEAVQLFMHYSFMAEGPSRAEVLRGCVQPGYFSYTLGKLMLLKLRHDLKARDGANFDLKAFHNECVGNGMPPVPLLRRKLLGANDKSSLL